MSKILTLPKYIFLQFLLDWVNVDDLCKLDTAHCNESKRPYFLHLFPFKQLVIFEGVEACLPFDFVSWLVTRNFSVKSLRLNISQENLEYRLDEHQSMFFPVTNLTFDIKSNNVDQFISSFVNACSEAKHLTLNFENTEVQFNTNKLSKSLLDARRNNLLSITISTFQLTHNDCVLLCWSSYYLCTLKLLDCEINDSNNDEKGIRCVHLFTLHMENVHFADGYESAVNLIRCFPNLLELKAINCTKTVKKYLFKKGHFSMYSDYNRTSLVNRYNSIKSFHIVNNTTVTKDALFSKKDTAALETTIYQLSYTLKSLILCDYDVCKVIRALKTIVGYHHKLEELQVCVFKADYSNLSYECDIKEVQESIFSCITKSGLSELKTLKIHSNLHTMNIQRIADDRNIQIILL